jgi:hypothetical protein
MDDQDKLHAKDENAPKYKQGIGIQHHICGRAISVAFELGYEDPRFKGLRIHITWKLFPYWKQKKLEIKKNFSSRDT